MPAPDRTADRLLHALKATGAQTAGVLAARLGITPVAVRQHLQRLETGGLVEFEDQRSSVGRPKRHWRLTPAGHARFPDNHAGLTLELLGAVSDLFGAAGLDRLIGHREHAMLATYRAAIAGAPGLGGQLSALARRRSAEGYMAEVEELTGGAWLLVENHCPICAAAAQCQGLCRSEEAVFAAVLAPARVSRVEHILAGARRCAYRVEPA
jgi:predicted ArsR family transcriptional regulator